jgi:hypothetical protein
MGADRFFITQLHSQAGRGDIEFVKVILKYLQGKLTKASAQKTLANVDANAGLTSASVDDERSVSGGGMSLVDIFSHLLSKSTNSGHSEAKLLLNKPS